MDEPSVLDYVKSKLTFWKPSSIHIPDREPEEAARFYPMPESQAVEAVVEVDADELNPAGLAAADVAEAGPVAQTSAAGLGLTAAALILALLAQAFLEPPNQTASVGVFLYLLAAILVGAGYLRGLIRPADIPAEDDNPQHVQFVRFEGLVIGFILMLVAFVLFGSSMGAVPEFGLFNTLAWVLSIAYLIWAFLLPGSGEIVPALRRNLAALRQPTWRFSFTRWTVLVLLVAGVVLFFRFHRLESLPAEMVSDHAEKLLDVSDVLNGHLRVFFPRNTGREAFQFHWTALMVRLFDTGISFMALKLGTVLGGLLTLFYTYRLGYQVGDRWVALYALAFTGFSYWANIQSRIGLRFPLYPMFLAPMLFYLIRGLRTANRNDFLWAGLWLGLGLHGYTSFRIVPLLVIVAIALYFFHHSASPRLRRFALVGLVLVGLVSLAVFIPLLRFTFDQPEMVAFRSLTRLSGLERPLPGPAWLIFFQNAWNALVMFFWNNGNVWVHSIPYRPALDVISAALFFLGLILVLLRYLRRRNWLDLFLLVAIPILLLPSILSLAFPNENPNLNRTTGAYIVVFLILAIGLDALLKAVARNLPGRLGSVAAAGLGLVLVGASAVNNYDLVFNQYDQIFRQSAWNTSEMGAVIRDFDRSAGNAGDAWVLAYPHWVDTRLVGINAGFPRRDTAISPEMIAETQPVPRSKLFIVNPQDQQGIDMLREVYPEGRFQFYTSRTPGKDFLIFLVPAREDVYFSPGGDRP